VKDLQLSDKDQAHPPLEHAKFIFE